MKNRINYVKEKVNSFYSNIKKFGRNLTFAGVLTLGVLSYGDNARAQCCMNSSNIDGEKYLTTFWDSGYTDILTINDNNAFFRLEDPWSPENSCDFDGKILYMWKYDGNPERIVFQYCANPLGLRNECNEGGGFANLMQYPYNTPNPCPPGGEEIKVHGNIKSGRCYKLPDTTPRSDIQPYKLQPLENIIKNSVEFNDKSNDKK